MSTRFPAELAAHLAKAVRHSRRHYRKCLKSCQKEVTEKAVHDLRVETRHTLALLDFLEALRWPARVKKIRKTLKKRLDTFDDLRDTQVQSGLLEPLWPDFPEARGFKKWLCRREKKLVRSLSQIQRTKNRELNRCLKDAERRLLSSARTTTAERGGTLALLTLHGTFREVMAKRRDVIRSNTATIHCLRVAFKRFRYMNELLDGFLTVPATQIEQMKEYQGLAGDVQDWDVLLTCLNGLVKSGEIERSAVKRLIAEVSRRRRVAIERFMKNIDNFLGFEPERSAIA